MGLQLRNLSLVFALCGLAPASAAQSPVGNPESACSAASSGFGVGSIDQLRPSRASVEAFFP